ncbi:hypothetical protein QAD02_003916 [Eretmocerus hayati]|uniref:Uncharacterized protein n=1 Tax=Eretmocerus hayati TaxID=131215 RepID=A0ACC2NQW5_9HYME|nr:hypothetical protein QAD02_003916 [Eretmocerus hayati]
MFLTKCASHPLFFLIGLYTVTGFHHNHIPHHSTPGQNRITPKELRRLSEELFEKLPRGTLQMLNIDYQGRRESKDAKDEAPEPLLMVPRTFFKKLPTIQLLQKLYDNYDMNSLHAESVTEQEILEEDEFIDAILNTSVMMHTMDFLARKGYFRKDLNEYKATLKRIWFTQYSRTNHTSHQGSSGFEHVFLVEKKRGNHITGLHNWIFFATEEYHNKADYLGYISKEVLADRAAVLKFYVSYLGKTKLTSMFIGTTPEFDIALFTLCFYARPNKNCKVLLGNTKVTIQSWVQYSNNEVLIGSSFPKIYN